jgi:Family of unknown function (DUF6152)
MRPSAFGLLAAVFGVFLVTPLPAHHSFSAEYDSKRQVTLKGIVTKVEWMNPHVYFYLDVKDESGDNITNWALEMGPPAGLERSGWTRNTIKVGDEVIVEATLAKDNSKQANARSVTNASTGKKLGAASSERAPNP